MRILLDESLPRTLARHFSGVSVETVYDRGWTGLKNGELLELAGTSFDAFSTADQNLQYQQNLKGYAIRVVVLAAVTNRAVGSTDEKAALVQLCTGSGEGQSCMRGLDVCVFGAGGSVQSKGMATDESARVIRAGSLPPLREFRS